MLNIFKWIKNLYSDKNLFAYESFILDSVIANLSDELVTIVSSQINELRCYNRQFGRKEVNFSYPINSSAQSLASKESRELLRLKIGGLDNSEIMTVDIIIYRGLLGGMTFHKYPKKFFKGISFANNNYPQIIESKLLCDPMIPDNDLCDKEIISDQLTGWVKSCYDRGMLINLKPPLEHNERQSYIDAFDTKFPDDYLEFLNQADYGELNGHLPSGYASLVERKHETWVYGNLIKGLRTQDPIIRLPFHNGLYYMIADISLIGSLVVRAGEYTGEVILMQYDDGDWETSLNTTSFVEAVNKTLQMLYEKHEFDIKEQIFI